MTGSSSASSSIRMVGIMVADTNKAARFFIFAGRLAGVLAILALVGAWVSELTDGMLFGLSQQHLFSDAIALSLVGIGLGLDGWLHSRNL